MDKQFYKALQEEMAEQVIIPENKDFKIRKQQLIFTFDIQYQGDKGFVAIDVQSYGGQQKGVHTYELDVLVEYQPGYFAFREGPLLLEAMEKLIASEGYEPSLLVIDGHGTAHPRKLGVASWLGIKSGVPSIGVAKEPLLKTEYKTLLEEAAGAKVDVTLGDETVGFVLRSQTGVKPIFVSAGHQISQSEALRISKKLRGPYRILEPIRRADQAARQAARTS